MTNFGTSFTNFGPGTINVGSPEHRHQSEIEEENWPGFLEAVIPSSLIVQRSEHIFAKVSKRSSDGSPGEYGSGSGWARTSCAVPFRTFDGSQRPTQIRLELVMTNPNILCSRRFFDLDLNWNDPQRQVSFEVYAKQEGIYSADIILLARRKHIATVTVSSEAKSDATSAKDEIYQVLAKVTITLEISLEHRTGIDKSSGKEPNIDQGLGMGM